jgi:predicted O-methyltransferase YrrM
MNVADIATLDPPAAAPAAPRPLVKRVRSYLRRRHRNFVLGRAIRSVRRGSATVELPERRFDDLTYGWNNDVWSASPAYMREVLRCAWQARGAILECGSGLTTLLLGAVAERTGARVCSLEHDEFWAERVRAALSLHRLRTAEVRYTELRSYGDYTWYASASQTLPQNISLVVCDGPPGETQGGRYGLLPRLRANLAPGCVILLDDAARPAEQQVLERWERELGTSHALVGSSKPFARLTVPI